MDFHFDPTFSLLPKFSLGLRPVPTSREEIDLVSTYLGIRTSGQNMEEDAKRLGGELEGQNDFLSRHLESDSIIHSNEYRQSKFVRDIVANNRQNRERRSAPSR